MEVLNASQLHAVPGGSGPLSHWDWPLTPDDSISRDEVAEYQRLSDAVVDQSRYKFMDRASGFHIWHLLNPVPAYPNLDLRFFRETNELGAHPGVI